MADTAFLITRIVSVCGEKRGANMAVLTAEWHDTLKHCDKADVNRAWAAYRNTPPCHWPKPAEILALIRAEQPRIEPPAYKPEPYTFAQDGRTIAEEVEHRKRVIAEARAKHQLPDPPVDWRTV